MKFSMARKVTLQKPLPRYKYSKGNLTDCVIFRANECKKLHLKCCLKGLTNEEKGGLKVVAFDRPSFKLFTLRFSNRSVQAPSCERPRTAPRTLFLSFANNNCFQIAVLRPSCMKKSVKLACHVNSNIAIGYLPKLQISLGIVALFEHTYL